MTMAKSTNAGQPIPIGQNKAGNKGAKGPRK